MSQTQPASGDPRWVSFGEIVRNRRHALGLSQHELTLRGGPSAATVRYMENAQAGPFSGKTITDTEKALGWSDGDFLRVLLTGVEPTIVENEATNVVGIEESIAGIHRKLDELAADGVTSSPGKRMVPVPEIVWIQVSELANSRDITIGEAVSQCIAEASESQS